MLRVGRQGEQQVAEANFGQREGVWTIT
jgi:hypothetical protein